MIIVRLMGGLGNQMFQYALARHIAIKNDTEVLFDLTSFSSDVNRKYSLGVFNIKANIAEIEQIESFNEAKKYKKNWMKIKNILCGEYIPKIREKKFTFDKNILEKGNNIYLSGLWQSEKYFNDIFNIIQDDFQVKTPMNDVNLKVADEIRKEPNSVSIHIRRGDYLENDNNYIGLCTLNYYYQAIEVLQSKMQDLNLFIFSDDIKWAKENFVSQHSIRFINHNLEENAYEDMRLMSLCQHNIIANSTFSWWGAWLNDNPRKISIAPKRWFKSNKLDYKDIVPETWIKI